MKKFILNLIFILTVSIWGYSQTGDGYVNYRAVRTHYGNGNTTQYPSHALNSTQFDLMFDLTNPANTLIGQGEVDADSSQGFAGGHPPNVGGDYFAVEYTGWFLAKASGSYMFYLYTDDSSEIWIGDTKVAGRYGGSGTISGWITLEANTWYPLMMRYQEYVGGDYGYLQMYSSMFNGYFYPGHPSYPVSNDPSVMIKPMEYNMNFKFGSSINPTNFSVNTNYRVSDQEIAQNSNSTSISLGSNGTVNIDNQIDETLIGMGKKATTTGGSVEWCVVYSYDNTNKRYRVGIDKREFTNGVDPTTISQLQLFDVWDGPVTFSSQDSSWANYYIYTETPLDFTNSTFSSNIRSMNYGNYALQAEFSFEDIMGYKEQYVVFNSPTSTNLQLLVDDIITVSDVYSAFTELTNRGIGMNEIGNEFGYGIQYSNSDLDRNGIFDYNDTYMMLDWLNGGTLFDTSYLSAIMRLIDTNTYNSISSTTWNGFTTKTMYPLNLVNGTMNYNSNVSVSWLGDVNLSHSPVPTSNLSVTGKSTQSKTKKSGEVESLLTTELNGTSVVVKIKLNPLHHQIMGTQYRLAFDKSILTYETIESTSNYNNFTSVRDGYLNFGSIITNGEGVLDSTTEYTITFKTNKQIKDMLGLVAITKSEAVNKEGVQLDVQIK